MAKSRFNVNRGFFNPLVVKANIAKQDALKAANTAPTGNMASAEKVLEAQYLTWLDGEKKAFAIKSVQARLMRRRIALPKYPTFAQWKQMRGLGMGLGSLGEDIFTTIGKSLKKDTINVVAPSISKITGVKVDKVKADLSKVKTKINPAKFIKQKSQESSSGNKVTPVVSVPATLPQDYSAGTPVLIEEQAVGFVMPKYILPVVGGVLIIGAVYYFNKRRA